MKKSICIHGHFYQPPREDPWLGKILPEGSAAPSRNWNERISRESYAPLAFAHRLENGQVVDIVNIYEWISFNAGPTLMSWMERAATDVYQRILEADQKSRERLGYGNAMAQIYHHIIMPLANRRDKELETAWAMEDFRVRFKREPEGMWLSEAAVDLETLDVLAAVGIKFVILSPWQCAAVADMDGQNRVKKTPGNLDIYQPYKVFLPSGRDIAAFFYHADISQAVAFERLLADGESFFGRISQASREGLLLMATDGETYGHHFKFGEMALAYVIDQLRTGRDGLQINNCAAHLAANPPTRQAFIVEPSSWSCAHGVERWRADCGCTTGGQPGWNQKWRAPLRRCLDFLRQVSAEHFATAGKNVFVDPAKAITDYGRVLTGSIGLDQFTAEHFLPGLKEEQSRTACQLLAMESWSLAAMASCAWFFEELTRIEPINALTCALRALDMLKASGGQDISEKFLNILAEAKSNYPEKGNGRDIWGKEVLPRRETAPSLILMAILNQLVTTGSLLAQTTFLSEWPGVKVAGRMESDNQGVAEITWRFEQHPLIADFSIQRPQNLDPLEIGLSVASLRNFADPNIAFGKMIFGRDLAKNKFQEIADLWAETKAKFNWNQLAEEAAKALSYIVDIQEAQETFILEDSWLHLWEPLTFLYLNGLDLPPLRQELLCCFIKRYLDRSRAGLFKVKLGEKLLELAEKRTWEKLTTLLERLQALKIQTDIWALQNQLWILMDKEPGVIPENILKLAGIARSGR